jgi:cell wall-associated NlpC family hydrolase
VKNLFIACSILFALGCGSSRNASSSPPSSQSHREHTSFEFIDNISTDPQSQGQQVSSHSSGSGVKYQADHESTNYSNSIENYSPLRFKYAILLDASVEELSHLNLRLLSFIEDWYGTRYHYGGNTKEGIDCSGFVYLLMSGVYNVNNLPRSAQDQYDASRRVSPDELKEGDLVFFHTQKNDKHNEVTHVGVYLLNHKFIHASISGVMISDLGQGYYFQHYVGAGRVGTGRVGW